jgi:hypothetical protein
MARFGEQINGVLSGFDRLVLSGSLRGLQFVQGMGRYLSRCGVLLKDFGEHVERVSQAVKQAALAEAERLGRPVLYLPSAATRKEETVQEILKRDGVQDGLVCVLTCVEPCMTYDIHRDRQAKRLELVRRLRKCLHVYHYRIDPEVGLCGLRLQTWFPFGLKVYLNGREWLARQMERSGLAYQRADNCFPWVEDWAKAQGLLGEQLRTDWPELLGRLASQIHPRQEELLGREQAQYYWTAHQSEWATDVVFRDGALLQRLYPRLVRQAMVGTGATDVLRFLGRPLPAGGGVPPRLLQEVTSDVKGRPEGLRIKHRAGANSLKAYDKAYTAAGAVLRAETTMNDPCDFKVYRTKQGQEEGEMQWLALRKGVADMHRRAEVCQKANERYLEALAVVEEGATLEELVEQVGRRVRWKKRALRGLAPLSPADRTLLEAVGRGEFALGGVRNCDLQGLLWPGAAGSPEERRRRSARVSRQLMLLRAHGLIHKLPRMHRYQITDLGRRVISAVLAAGKAPVSKLISIAA